jgi:NADH:ubiquinone oxidoreductase subunit 5 (subunit L)/multisubunit Na+/H+ antiporter MnhA subunit
VNAGHPYIALTFILGAVMTLIYLLRAFAQVFLGDPRGHVHPEGSRSMVFSVAFLAVLSLVSGLLINYPAGLVNNIVSQMAVIVK